MMKGAPIKAVEQVINITLKGRSQLSLRIGQTLEAIVIEAAGGTKAMLKIMNKHVEVKTDIALTKGETLLVKVEKGVAPGMLRLRVVSTGGFETNAVKAALRAIVKGLEPARLQSAELNSFKETITNIDKTIMAKVPELKALAEFFKPIESSLSNSAKGMGGAELKKAVESSGLFLEARISKAITSGVAGGGGKDKELKRMIDIITKGDFKGSLIKLREALKEVETIQLLKAAKIKPEEMILRVDKIIKNAEFFQVQSRFSDAIDLFIPFFWKSLRDGELIFSESYKGASEGKSYSCTLNLDLESTGRVSAIVLLMYGSVHLSFVAEKKEFIKLINDNIDALKGQFRELGLPLGSIRASREENLDFKEPQRPFEDGFNVKA